MPRYNTYRSLAIHEWRQLCRTRLLPVIAAILLPAAIMAICYGHAVAVKQQAAVDSLQQRYQQQLNTLCGQLLADTATPQGKAAYIAAAWPIVADHRLHAVAWYPPAPGAILSVGMSDLAKYYYPVAVKSSYAPAEEKISNPLQLATGNFDSAFLLIYLMPLLAICMSYQLLSHDKEQGTLSLLLVQHGTLTRLLLLRLLIRYLLLLAVMILICTAGMALSAQKFPWPEWAAWIGVAAAWLAFWMGLAWFVIAWNQHTVTNLVALFSLWLLLLIVLPAGFRLMTYRPQTDDTAANASVQRQLEWDTWDLPKRQLLDSFYHAYPQYRNARAYDTGMTSSRHAMAYYFLVDQRMQRMTDAQTAHKHAARQALDASLKYNPAVYTQWLLNSISRTGISDYDHFREQARRFRGQWKLFFYERHFHDRLMTDADYQSLPVYHPSYDQDSPARWRSGILYLLTLTVALLCAGALVLKRKLNDLYKI
jgi:ABC-2 type transport system permease protein